MRESKLRLSSGIAPSFSGLTTYYVITAAWAVAFALMVAAEFALLYVPIMPHRLGVLVIIAALVGAVKFTSWYPERVRSDRDNRSSEGTK
jgi:hypothetical protein